MTAAAQGAGPGEVCRAILDDVGRQAMALAFSAAVYDDAGGYVRYVIARSLRRRGGPTSVTVTYDRGHDTYQVATHAVRGASVRELAREVDVHCGAELQASIERLTGLLIRF